jgi:dienelactone hydrolase
VLDGWAEGEHVDAATAVVHPTYRKGTGPGVVVVAEIPGITEDVPTFADEAPEDLTAVERRAAAGCSVLGLTFFRDTLL